MGVGGVIVPPDDYFPLVRAICDKYQVLFIADEVITGFGRTGEWFGLKHWNVKPDILSFAKAITSGYAPLGGIQISDEIRATMESATDTEAYMHGCLEGNPERGTDLAGDILSSHAGEVIRPKTF